MLQGGFVIEDRTVTLADIDRPVLTVVGDGRRDRPGRRACARSPAPRRGPRSTSSACAPGTSGSSSARRRRRRPGPRSPAGRAGAPARRSCRSAIRRVDGRRAGARGARGRHPARGRARARGRGRRRLRPLARRRRVARDRRRPGARRGGHRASCRAWRGSAGSSPHTRVSLGLLLDEQAAPRTPTRTSSCSRTAPTRTRRPRAGSTTSSAACVSLGVRQGEHVGVLMSTRPSGLSVVAALNRLGAVAVLMRPDGPVAREAELGQVTRIVADPELAGRARARPAASEVLVLGGGGEERDLGGGRDRHGADRPRPGRAAGLVPAEPRAARRTSPSSSSPARASAPGPTGSPTGAGRCRRSRPPRRRRSPTTTPSTR